MAYSLLIRLDWRMIAHTIPAPGRRRKRRSFLALPLVPFLLLLLAAAAAVAYLLWPQWPGTRAAVDAPSLPITVAGVLFEIPPAAIRVEMQRQPGPHDRIDLEFLWPSLRPPQDDGRKPDVAAALGTGAAVAEPARLPSASTPKSGGTPLFLTITPLGPVLPPRQRLREIYPRYIESKPAAGPTGLLVLPFRHGTPYQDEDLVSVKDDPESFFALCTRPTNLLPGICMASRAIGAAEITLRFNRAWLDDWHRLKDGIDRLIAQLHPASG